MIMRYYREIHLSGEMEIALGFIWRKLYEQLHRSLVDISDAEGKVSVGFSFPRYDKDRFPLGDRLRIFSPEKNMLDEMKLDKRLIAMNDYLQLSEIYETPENSGFAIFRRRQFKTNPKRLARRYAKRHNISIEESEKRYQNFKEEEIIKRNQLAFINFHSSSTGQRIRIFIEKIDKSEEMGGKFNTFGLSREATVPEF
ncbi:type I-F CRISPR-associated endoribonuclease Cas6/Csy4 [Hydrogenimonas sp. SS33]|uniref:type I-F CRISPR-associated endoribonuclease Cas6/Csy4 n=1 Tax=Hydrogenimonas leucolamina TaxID=2954236 RepID=UPI00336BE320